MGRGSTIFRRLVLGSTGALGGWFAGNVLVHARSTPDTFERSPDARLSHATCPRCRRRRRIAVYGGAFDPVTNGHLSCAAEIVHSGIADEVLMVPCGPRPDKPKMATAAIDRYVMLQIAVNTSFSPGFPVKVSNIEVFEPKSLATYDMLSSLRAQNPGVDFMFVVGSDWLQSGQDLRHWTSKEGKTGEKLVSEFDFLIIKRPGYDLPENLSVFGPRFSVLSLPHGMNYVDSNVSSTEIRKRVAVSEQVREFVAGSHLTSADGLVPTGVLAYITRQGLYKKPAK
eukprot:TRINITY_DN3614_c0_g1_i1.p1 TRINITY_DN3614_c0_g1~~TRINITY_DN3614_c0_g1_i1.p1  ORF type:complete len:283 (+),score=17.28 TRINITY_DN3614_c0_g1_i1:48-896(+)